MVVTTAGDVRASQDDPGIAAFAILNVTGDAIDVEGVTIGADTYETDIAADGVVAGSIAVVPSTNLTPTNYTPALVAAINTLGTESVSAIAVSTAIVLVFTSTTRGSLVPAASAAVTVLAEDLTNAAWDTLALRGGRAAGLQVTAFDARVPNALEVTLGLMEFVFPFAVDGAMVQIRITATGIAKIWVGGLTIDGYRVIIDNTGATDFAATDTVYVFAYGA